MVNDSCASCDSCAAVTQKEENGKKVKNSAVGAKMFDSEISSTVDKAIDTYRWYLCTQTTPTPTGWTCERKNTNEILGTVLQQIGNKKSIAMIPVYKFIPSVFDNMVISRSIRSMTHIKIIQ